PYYGVIYEPSNTTGGTSEYRFATWVQDSRLLFERFLWRTEQSDEVLGRLFLYPQMNIPELSEHTNNDSPGSQARRLLDAASNAFLDFDKPIAGDPVGLVQPTSVPSNSDQKLTWTNWGNDHLEGEVKFGRFTDLFLFNNWILRCYLSIADFNNRVD